MKRLPYNKLERILFITGFAAIILSYIVYLTNMFPTSSELLSLVIMTFLYIFLLLFEYFPQTTNIVTSKKYKNASWEVREMLEHRVRLMVSIFRCFLAALHIIIQIT